MTTGAMVAIGGTLVVGLIIFATVFICLDRDWIGTGELF